MEALKLAPEPLPDADSLPLLARPLWRAKIINHNSSRGASCCCSLACETISRLFASETCVPAAESAARRRAGARASEQSRQPSPLVGACCFSFASSPRRPSAARVRDLSSPICACKHWRHKSNLNQSAPVRGACIAHYQRKPRSPAPWPRASRGTACACGKCTSHALLHSVRRAGVGDEGELELQVASGPADCLAGALGASQLSFNL